jgi:hypothetical protein
MRKALTNRLLKRRMGIPDGVADAFTNMYSRVGRKVNRHQFVSIFSLTVIPKMPKFSSFM